MDSPSGTDEIEQRTSEDTPCLVNAFPGKRRLACVSLLGETASSGDRERYYSEINPPHSPNPKVFTGLPLKTDHRSYIYIMSQIHPSF